MDVQVFPLTLGEVPLRLPGDAPGQKREEPAQQGLEHEVRLGVGFVVGQHGLHQLQKLPVVLAVEDQPFASQAQAPQAALALAPVEADPEIGPGVLLAGLIEGLLVGLDQEAVPLAEQVVPVLHPVGAAAVQDVVEEVVGPHGGTVAVQGLAAGVAAVAEIEVRELLVLLLQMQDIALFHRFTPAGPPETGCPSSSCPV